MVQLVLDDAGQKAFGPHPHFAALLVQCFHANFGVSGNLPVYVLDAQTAFIIFLDLALSFYYLGIYKNDKTFVVSVIKIITDNNYAVRLVDLDGGQGNADFMGSAGFPI